MTASARMWLAAALLAALIVAIIIAGVTTSFQLQTPQAAFWDISIKAVGSFVAIAGVLLTLAKYLDEKASLNRAALREARKPLADKREIVYTKLLEATAIYANSDPGSERRMKAEAEFWSLFWGAIPVVADDDVGAAVNEFHLAIGEKTDDFVALRNLSMNLALAVRKSLEFDKAS